MTHHVPRSFVLTTAAIVALLPFAADMYLSSLPAIGADFSAPVWVTQLTLTGFLLVLGLGQLVAGPITDAIGRRKPLFVGLGLFVAGSALAALAPSIGVLVAGRLVQGVGGALAVVVVNSSVRDRVVGQAATRLYAVLMTVAGLAPVVAPAAGGIVEDLFGWRSVFVLLGILGALVAASAAAFQHESLPAERRTPLAFAPVLSAYRDLLRMPAFVRPLAAISALFMMLFAYIGGASYVYQGRYSLDPAAFGLVFGGTGMAFLLGAVTAHRMAASSDLRRQSLVGGVIALAGALLAVVATGTGAAFAVVVTGMAVALFGLGVAEPALMSWCMSSVRSNTGSAAALIGASQYGLGAVATVVAGIAASSGPAVWAVLIAVLALVSVVITRSIPSTPALGDGYAEAEMPAAPVSVGAAA